MKPELRIHHVDTYNNEQHTIITQFLQNTHTLIHDPKTPQLIIHGIFIENHTKGPQILSTKYETTPKLHITADPAHRTTYTLPNPLPPNHHAITQEINPDPNHHHYPYYLYYANWNLQALTNAHTNPPNWTTKKDISFIYTNPHPTHRNNYYHTLNQHFKINSTGKHLNNTGTHTPNNPKAKTQELTKHAYDLAIENTITPGYTTEKLLQPIIAQTIPIYYGHPPKHINPARYIQAPPNPNDLIHHIQQLNQNPHLAQNIIQQPALYNPNHITNEQNQLQHFINNITHNLK